MSLTNSLCTCASMHLHVLFLYGHMYLCCGLCCIITVLFLGLLHAEAHSLILWMLSHQPEDRPSIEDILDHPWMKMTSPSSSSSGSSSGSPRGSSSPSLSSSTLSLSVNSPSASPYHQSPLHKSITGSRHHLHPHYQPQYHHCQHQQHHMAPMPTPHFTRQMAPKPVKTPSTSPYLTRAAVASSYTPPSHSRPQASLSPRSPVSLCSASRVSLGTSASSGCGSGSNLSLTSTGSSTSINSIGMRGNNHALCPSSPQIPLTNSRRTRLQAATRRK